jgi:hypothetical protein
MFVAFAVNVTEVALVKRLKNQDCLKILTKGQEDLRDCKLKLKLIQERQRISSKT